ncbi:unnamed protein product, partial [Ilex paraguariensis]
GCGAEPVGILSRSWHYIGSFSHLRGAEPNQLAFSAALGITLGVFPICGVTVFLCGLAIAVLGSFCHAPTVMLTNFTATPIELSVLKSSPRREARRGELISPGGPQAKRTFGWLSPDLVKNLEQPGPESSSGHFLAGLAVQWPFLGRFSSPMAISWPVQQSSGHSSAGSTIQELNSVRFSLPKSLA